jgi:NAD(P)-dependent dehydrogenase (short-subunit alcohol dehydrogenase family)
MSEVGRYVRPPSAESRGEAPGRGRLQGRKVLVVGGGQRIFDAATDPIGNGRAMSILFAREGARVAVADRNATSAAETVARIRDGGGHALAIEADITREADVVRMVAEAAEGLAGLDGIVLNVGIGAGSLRLAGVTQKDWDETLAVNLRGPMLCCREALPKLAEGSSIVFISSIAGLTAGSQLVAYDASKAALSGLMRHVGLEGSRRGIRANVAVPVSSTRRSAVWPAPGERPGAPRRSRSGGRRPAGRSRTPPSSSSPARACTSPARRSRWTAG